jgi:dTDP-4-dehydrorhamnose 3,5-epimerase
LLRSRAAGVTLLDKRKEAATVTPTGEPIARLIEGVSVRLAVNQEDDRGDLTEIYDPAWGMLDAPMVYAYQTTIRPGKVRGWVYHELQTDRVFVSYGSVKLVLYDLREESSTYRMVNEIFLSDRKRGLVIIPTFVAHAMHNVGATEAMFVNLPTRPYNHAKPDKIRVTRESIPYSFDKGIGW